MSNNNIIDGSGIVVPSSIGNAYSVGTNPDGNSASTFGTTGFHVSGNIAAVASIGETVSGKSYAGRVNIFRTDTSQLLAQIDNPNPATYDMFGLVVALHGNYLAISTNGDDPNGTSSGSVWIYDLSNPSSPVLMSNLNGTFQNNFLGQNMYFTETSGSEVLLVVQAGRTSSSNQNRRFSVYKLDDILSNYTNTSFGATLQQFETGANSWLTGCRGDYLFISEREAVVNQAYSERAYEKIYKYNANNDQYEFLQNLYNQHEADCSFSGVYPNVSQSTRAEFSGRGHYRGVDISDDGNTIGVALDVYKNPDVNNSSAYEGAFSKYVWNSSASAFEYDSIVKWADVQSAGQTENPSAGYTYWGSSVTYHSGKFMVPQFSAAMDISGNILTAIDESDNSVDLVSITNPAPRAIISKPIVSSGNDLYWVVLPRIGYQTFVANINKASITPEGARAIAVTGDVQQGAFSPYAAGGYSTRFIYDEDNWKATSTDFVMGTDDFTVEMWIYPDGSTPVSSTINHTLFNFGDTNYNNVNDRIALSRSPETGRLRFHYGANSLNVVTPELGWAVTEYSTWSHVAVTRESGTFKFWVDGALRRSDVVAFNMTNDVLSIGYDGYYGSDRSFNGLISDVRVVKGTAVYTTDFTPPTEPLTLTNETVLLTCNKPYMSAVSYQTIPASVSSSVDETFTPASDSLNLTPGSYNRVDLTSSAMSPNGNYMAVGAYFESSSHNNAGAVKVYDISGSDPTLLYTFNGQEDDAFGKVIYMTDSQLIVISTTLSGTYIYSASDYPTASTLSSQWLSAIRVYDLSTGNQVGVTKKKVGYSMSPENWSYNVDKNVVISFDRQINTYSPSGSNWHRGIWGWDLSDTTNENPSFHITGATGDWEEGSISTEGEYILVGLKAASSDTGKAFVYSITDAMSNGLSQGTISSTELVSGSVASNAKFGEVVYTDGTNFYVTDERSSIGHLYVYDSSYNLTNTISMADIDNDSSWQGGWSANNPLGVVGNYLFVAIESEATVAILDKTDSYAKIGEFFHPEGVTPNTKLYRSFHFVAQSISADASKFVFCSAKDPGLGGAPSWTDGAGRAYLYSLTFSSASSGEGAVTTNLIGDVNTERTSPYGFTDYSAASHGGSAYFDGTGDELLIAASDDFNFGTGDFTIEMWIKPDSMTDGTIWKNDNMRIQVFPDYDHGDGTSDYIQVQESSNVELKYPLGYAFDGVWVHIALVRENGTIKLFANGSEITNTVTGSWGNISQNFDYSSTGQMFIGSNGAGNNMQGHISDVRVVKGSAVYTADFTVPTAPLAAVTGTTLLLPFDDATIIDKSGSSVIDVQGDVAVSDVAPPYVGGKSLTFDGTGDYVEAKDANISLSGDFTIEAWVKPTSLSGQIVGLADGSGVKISTNGSNYDVVFHDGSSDVITSSATYSTTASVSLTTTLEGTESAARFGYTSASCESYYVLSAPNSSGDSGKVEIYRVADNTLLATVANPNTSTGSGDYFGRAVAITETHLLVGAPGMEHNQTSFVGAAYLFDISNLSSPVLLRTLRPSDTGIQQSFGQTVAMSDTYYSISNNVGSATTSPKPSERQVWLYGLDDHNAAAVHSFNNRSDSNSSNGYGAGMFISDTHIAISDRMYKVGGTNYAGRVYVYALSDFSEVSAIDNHDFNNNNNFGGNGTKGVLLNSTHLFVSEHSNRGRVYVYDLSTSNLEHTLESINDSDENFGQGLDISDDYLVISGKSRFVIYDPSGDFSSELMSFDPSPVPAYSDYFGQWVAISGTKIIISAWGLDPSAGTNAGGAYVYELPGADFTAWKHVAVSRSSGTVKMFIDGVSVGNSSGHTVTVGTSGGVMLGSNTSNGNLFTGEIADVIVLAYAKYTVDFVVPAGQSWGQAVVAL